MARALEVERPYMNIKTYLAYKKKGIDILTAHEEEIKRFREDETNKEENS